MSALSWRSAARLLRLACWIGLFALLSTAVGVLFPYALPVVFAMSVGQGLGALALICYLLAIIAEAQQREAGPSGRTRPSAGPERS